MLGTHRTKICLAQLGSLNQRPKVDNAVGTAKNLQSAFDFSFSQRRIEISESYLLPNGAYDLDRALAESSEIANLPRPLILITSLPYGDHDTGHSEDWYYFGDPGDEENRVAVISTYLVEGRWCEITIEAYIMTMLSLSILSFFADLQFHDDTRGCLFDYCDDPRDAEVVMKTASDLCRSCERALNAKLRSGAISNLQIAAARKIFGSARKIVRCFLVMPFATRFKRVRTVIDKTVANAGWKIVRADDVARPRRITDAIIQELLTADLLLADITDANANVFYELGFAHAAGCDTVMLCQDHSRPIPFDVFQERTIFYNMSKLGLQKLAKDLKKLINKA